MVIFELPRLTTAEFDAFVDLPENAERLFEYIAGRAVEVPSNAYASKLAGLIFGEIYIYLKSNDIGHLTSEAGGYMVDGERYAPDVAFISYARQPKLAGQGYNPNPPELAVEVISDPTNAVEQENLRIKISHYMTAQTTVWVFNFSSQTVEVYVPGQSVEVIDKSGTLSGGQILPGFTLTLSEIFREDDSA